MTKRKFYKTLITIEVLSEEPIPDNMDVPQIMEEATEGGYSAMVLPSAQKILNGKQAASALLNQASSPSFFQLTYSGEDLE